MKAENSSQPITGLHFTGSGACHVVMHINLIELAYLFWSRTKSLFYFQQNKIDSFNLRAIDWKHVKQSVKKALKKAEEKYVRGAVLAHKNNAASYGKS